MLHPEIDLAPQSSPSISSVSSSDFDSESTGSFFHDRSTSLGTLMGVSFPSISVRVSSSRREHNNNSSNAAASSCINGGSLGGGGDGDRKKKKKKKQRRKVVVVVGSSAEKNRRWWRLCRDDVARPASSSSLADFLEVERRFDDGEFYGATAELEGMVQQQQPRSSSGINSGRRLLFADGRVLPPAPHAAITNRTEVVAPSTSGAALCNFPVLLSGICSGGGGSSSSGV